MKKIIGMVLMGCLMVLFCGCNNNANAKNTDNEGSSNQQQVAAANNSDQAYPQVQLEGVSLVGEFSSIYNANSSMGQIGEMTPSSITENSRFVIIRYDFTTLPEAGSMATYGSSVTLWKGEDPNASDAGIDSKYLVFDDNGAAFENGVFTISGIASKSFTYKPNEKHSQYRVMVVPNSVKLSEMKIHFSNKATKSNIGYDFKLAELK